ncbi:DUF4232 domain-containing protein [Saccharopolyspora sp. ID03-671]|uniref:DUF4232 domain-containing protein n=1 Tax=Saccharopolyspora sp. ID03-671 TaxID=3073066 RepID=UPI00324B2B44
MSKTSRKTLAVTGIVAGALLATGGGAAALAQHGSGAETASVARVSATQPGQDQDRADIGTSNCSAEDFIASASAVQGRPGHFLVSFGNRSDKTCTINGGVPALAGLDMTNSPIEELPVDKISVPGAPEEFTLQPGDLVHTEIEAVSGPNAPDTYVVSGFQGSLPDMSQPQPIHVTGTDEVRLEVTGLRITSLVAGPDALK